MPTPYFFAIWTSRAEIHGPATRLARRPAHPALTALAVVEACQYTAPDVLVGRGTIETRRRGRLARASRRDSSAWSGGTAWRRFTPSPGTRTSPSSVTCPPACVTG